MSGIIRVNNPPSWDDTAGRNRAFLISIVEGNGGETVTGYLPEQISETVASRWEPLMTWSPTGVLRFISALAGKGGQFAWQNAMIWSGQEPYTLDIPIEFHAKNNAKVDVYDKCQALLAMASPRVPKGDGGQYGLLEPPGPNLAPKLISDMGGSLSKVSQDVLKGLGFETSAEAVKALGTEVAKATNTGQAAPAGHPISVHIGNIRTVRNCLIQNVSLTYGVPLDPQGYPLKAEANISIQMAEVFTRDHAEGKK